MTDYKLGRNRPLVVGPHLRLSNYMMRKMPSPPSTINYINAAQPFLNDILGNDRNGDCTIAAAFHIGGMLLQNAGQPLPSEYNTTTALALYYRLTGGADSGLDEQTVFNWWQSHGLSNNAHRIVARVLVDSSDREQVETALWLFENIYMTAELPDDWLRVSGNSFLWDVAGDSNPDNGHAFCGCAYGPLGVSTDSWGIIGTLTWDALAKYCTHSAGGGCYAVVSADAINQGTQKAPNGFDWSQLQADISSFRV